MRLAREKERELKELERATRTVFAYNISLKAGEREIFDFFSGAGVYRHAGFHKVGIISRVSPKGCGPRMGWSGPHVAKHSWGHAQGSNPRFG